MKGALRRKLGLALVITGGLLLALGVSYLSYVKISEARFNDLIEKVTPTPTMTSSPSPAPSATLSPTPALTATTTDTPTPTPTADVTSTPVETLTATEQPTSTTEPPTMTGTTTLTPSPTPTETPTPTLTITTTPPAPTVTESPAPTPTTATETVSSTDTATPTATESPTATITPTPISTITPAPILQLPKPVHIRIQSIGVDAEVVEAGLVPKEGQLTFWNPPREVVAHFANGINPGMKGNIVMYGHVSSMFGRDAVFRDLYKIQLGDEVIIENEEGEYLVYEVIEPRELPGAHVYARADSGAWIVVNENQVWPLTPSDEPILTLITCFPPPPGLPTARQVVTARLVYSPYPESSPE